MAKKFAIMRGDKLHTGEMRGSIAHVSRSQKTPNADPQRRHLNYSIVGPDWDDARGIQAAVEACTPKKYRKDAVRLLEFIVTASPEWFADNPDDVEAYFEHAVGFYQQEYGAENVVSAVVHRDETSPHMHLYAVPIDPKTGNLNAKKLFGGRGDMSRRQSRFAEHMHDFGVVRGERNPARKHTQVRDWYKGQADLDEREAALAAREKAVAADVQKAANKEGNAVAAYALARQERSAAAYAMQQAADRESALEQREQALAARERELSEKVAALDAAAQKFEQQKTHWISENKPTVPPLVRHLQHLETLSMIESAEYLAEQDNDELYDLFSPQDGLTEHGKALLDRYKNVQERAEKFEETFTPSSSGPGL